MTLADRARTLRIAEHLYGIVCEAVGVMPDGARRRIAPVLLGVGMRLIRKSSAIARDVALVERARQFHGSALN